MNAEWISLVKNKTSITQPKVTLLSDDNTSTVMKIELYGFDATEFNSEGNTYMSVDLLTEVFTTEPGFPEVPYIAKVLAIPDHAGISVEVLEMSEVQTFENIHLPPARSSWWEGDMEFPYAENAEVYQSNETFPNGYTSMESPAVFRDFRVVRVSVFPVRYNPAKKELQVVSSITVRVNYGTGEVLNPKTSSDKGISPSFGKLYRSFIFNYWRLFSVSGRI